MTSTNTSEPAGYSLPLGVGPRSCARASRRCLHIPSLQEPEGVQEYGLCWGAASLIDVDHFIGRAAGLDEVVRVL